MSEENVEIVRTYVEGCSDLAPGDTAMFVAEFWDRDGDYYPAQKFPEARPCHGHEEIARFLAEYLRAWERFEMVINRLAAIGDDRVLDHVTLRAEGRESGMTLDGDLYHCVWLRHGRLLRQEDHFTLGGAIRGLGLSGKTVQAAGFEE